MGTKNDNEAGELPLAPGKAQSLQSLSRVDAPRSTKEMMMLTMELLVILDAPWNSFSIFHGLEILRDIELGAGVLADHLDGDS